MPSKYPVLKPGEIISVLERNGFIYVSQRGSHRKYSNGKRTTIIPMHGEVPKGTLKDIIEQAGLSLDDFL